MATTCGMNRSQLVRLWIPSTYDSWGARKAVFSPNHVVPCPDICSSNHYRELCGLFCSTSIKTTNTWCAAADRETFRSSMCLCLSCVFSNQTHHVHLLSLLDPLETAKDLLAKTRTISAGAAGNNTVQRAYGSPSASFFYFLFMFLVGWQESLLSSAVYVCLSCK